MPDPLRLTLDAATLAREPLYAFEQLTEYDVVMLAAGLATPSVRAMAHLALSGGEELVRNAEKPGGAGDRKRRVRRPHAAGRLAGSRSSPRPTRT